MNLAHMLEFSRFIDSFKEIDRTIYFKKGKRQQNDTEHSYDLAMLAWYFCLTHKLKLDTNKVLRYALVHDLVEIYSGDTYYVDSEALEDKEERERLAFVKIQNQFPEVPELWNTIKDYEKKEDAESKLVYALDKIQPTMQIYINGGQEWIDFKVVKGSTEEFKKNKVSADPLVEKYFYELMELINTEQGHMMLG